MTLHRQRADGEASLNAKVGRRTGRRSVFLRGAVYSANAAFLFAKRGAARSMERPTTTTIRIGDWCVNPASGQISRDGETARPEVRTMRLLLCLAEHAGEVVSIDDLLNQVWPGVVVSSDSVYQAVASLRRLLGDDPKQPAYIATVPRLGYRMVATVSPWVEEPIAKTVAPVVSPQASQREVSFAATSNGPRPRSRRRDLQAIAAGMCLAVAVAISFLLHTRAGDHRPVKASVIAASQTQKS